MAKVTIQEVLTRVRRGLADTHLTVDRSDIEALADAVEAHEAAPAALGTNVLMYAPAGPVTLTTPQREEILRELNARAMRIADLKLALGDNAGWFDRAMAAEKKLCERGE